jgi:hypothetical protein
MMRFDIASSSGLFAFIGGHLRLFALSLPFPAPHDCNGLGQESGNANERKWPPMNANSARRSVFAACGQQVRSNALKLQTRRPRLYHAKAAYFQRFRASCLIYTPECGRPPARNRSRLGRPSARFPEAARRPRTTQMGRGQPLRMIAMSRRVAKLMCARATRGSPR